MRRKKKIVSVLRKIRIPKSLIHASIGLVVLIILFVGGGIAYTYFSEPADIPEREPVATTSPPYGEPLMSDSEPAPDASVGVSQQMLTTPIAPGSNATFTVRTLRGAECEILVEYNDIASTDSGLVPKTANDHGMASWTWTVEETVPEGEWPIEVLCSRNEKSGMLRADLHVTYDQEDSLE